MKKFVLLVTLIIVVTSCKKDELFIVDPRVKEHYDSFMYEAEKRGVKVDHKRLNQIKLTGPINSNGVDAAGIYDSDTKTIKLDTTSGKFINALEVLMYHELGHALLHREHREGLFPCSAGCIQVESIMHSTFVADYKYDTYKREYYVNELFNINEPKPYWAQ